MQTTKSIIAGERTQSVDKTSAEVAAHNALPEVQAGLEIEWQQSRQSAEREAKAKALSELAAKFESLIGPINKKHGTRITFSAMRTQYGYDQIGITVNGGGYGSGNHIGNYKFGSDGQPNWEKILAGAQKFADHESAATASKRTRDEMDKAGRVAFEPYKERTEKAFSEYGISATLRDGMLSLSTGYGTHYRSLFAKPVSINQLLLLVAAREAYNATVAEILKF